MNFLTRNPNELHIMLDLETLSTQVPNARVTEIGACIITEHDNFLDSSKQFHKHIHDIQHYPHTDADTCLWRLEHKLPWVNKSAGAIDPEAAIMSFFAWLNALRNDGPNAPKEIIIWSKGIDFDIPIFKNLVTRYLGADYPLPWKYNAIRDMRTLMKTFPQFEIDRDAIEHTALADCINQSKCLVKIADFIQNNIDKSWDPMD
jgi:hypothetical protein